MQNEDFIASFNKHFLSVEGVKMMVDISSDPVGDSVFYSLWKMYSYN